MKTKRVYKKKAVGKAKISDLKEIEKKDEIDVFIVGNPEIVDAGFVKFFFSFTQEIIENTRLAGKAIRLLFWIVNRLKYGELKFVMLEEDVVKDLKISSKTFYRWRKTLLEEGIIIQIAKNVYAINPAKVFKGKAHPLLRDWKELERLFSQREEGGEGRERRN